MSPNLSLIEALELSPEDGGLWAAYQDELLAKGDNDRAGYIRVLRVFDIPVLLCNNYAENARLDSQTHRYLEPFEIQGTYEVHGLPEITHLQTVVVRCHAIGKLITVGTHVTWDTKKCLTEFNSAKVEYFSDGIGDVLIRELYHLGQRISDYGWEVKVNQLHSSTIRPRASVVAG